MESNCFRAVPSLHIHWTSSCYSLFGSIQERLGNLYIEWPRRSSLAVVGYYMITSGIDPQKTRLSSRPSTGTEYQWRARGKLWKHNFLGKASQNLWQIWRNMREIERRGGAFLAVFRLQLFCLDEKLHFITIILLLRKSLVRKRKNTLPSIFILFLSLLFEKCNSYIWQKILQQRAVLRCISNKSESSLWCPPLWNVIVTLGM